MDLSDRGVREDLVFLGQPRQTPEQKANILQIWSNFREQMSEWGTSKQHVDLMMKLQQPETTFECPNRTSQVPKW